MTGLDIRVQRSGADASDREEKEDFILGGGGSQRVEHQRIGDDLGFNVDVDQPVFKLHCRKTGTVIAAQPDFPGAEYFFCQGDKIFFFQILADILNRQRIGVQDVIKFTFMDFLRHAAVTDERKVIFEFRIAGIT